MAKTIWKGEIPLGPDGAWLLLSGPLLPHVELTATGLNVWFEVAVFDEPVRRDLRVVLTGQMIPESWQWIATAKDGGFVGHLYDATPSTEPEGGQLMRERLRAMCKLLESDGHMTPVATRQILAVVEAEQHADALAEQSARYASTPMQDDAGRDE